MAEREKDDRRVDQMLKNHISQEHNYTLDLKVEDNGRESESVINRSRDQAPVTNIKEASYGDGSSIIDHRLQSIDDKQSERSNQSTKSM